MAEQAITYEDVTLSYGRTRTYTLTGRPFAHVVVRQEQMAGWYAAKVEWNGARNATPEAAEQIAQTLLHAAQTANEWNREKGLTNVQN